MNKIYTLLRPALDYDESEVTYAAFLTFSAAERAREEILEFCKNLKEKIGEEPRPAGASYKNWTPEEFETFSQWNLNLSEILNSAAWPYDCGVYAMDLIRGDLKDEMVEIGELTLF